MVLYLEPIGGFAGDMFLAAALDLGIDQKKLELGLSGLEIEDWKLVVTQQQRHSLVGKHVDVQATSRGEHAHRKYSEICRIIEGARTLSETVRRRALRVFAALGEAEAKIHAQPLEALTFHEVGAVDSIVDICGASLAVELLGEPEIFCGIPPLGSGSTPSAHGNLPVPPPAVLEILQGVPVRFEGVGELTTPTGAALIKTLCQVRPPPVLAIERVGYGLGSRELADRPNVLRASLGQSNGGSEGAVVIEANLDDCSPQLLASLVEDLLALGALDAYIIPAIMKKGRPGHVVGALVPAAEQERCIEAILTGTTTLGVRFHRVERVTADRQVKAVETSFGTVRIKVATRRGKELNAMPEYEDCRKLARERGVPVKQVWIEALAAYKR